MIFNKKLSVNKYTEFFIEYKAYRSNTYNKRNISSSIKQ